MVRLLENERGAANRGGLLCDRQSLGGVAISTSLYDPRASE
jgi:hypothetical protein